MVGTPPSDNMVEVRASLVEEGDGRGEKTLKELNKVAEVENVVKQKTKERLVLRKRS